MLEYLRQNLLNKAQEWVDKLGVGGLKGKISDGYHSFDELYDHRNTLFIALCKEIYNNPAYQSDHEVWRQPIKNGWFLMGINLEAGKQISYRLPADKWDDTNFLLVNPHEIFNFDGHTPQDVLERIKKL